MSRITKLFYVKMRNGLPVRGDDGEIRYFAHKPQAKRVRNSYEGATIARGPDHWKGAT